jgi:hypothetical protein
MNFIILYLGLLTFLGINKKATSSFTLNGSSSTVLDVCGTGNTNPISSLVFNGTASQNETGHFIEIYETDAVNSNNVTGVYYSNHFSGAAGSIDLVSIYNFKDNKIYRIKLATYNGCTSWIEQVKYVRVIGKPTINASLCYEVEEAFTISFSNTSPAYSYRYDFNQDFTDSKPVVNNLTENLFFDEDFHGVKFTIYVRNETCQQLSSSKEFRMVDFNRNPQFTHCTLIQERLASNQEENKQEVEVVPNPTEGVIEVKTTGLQENVKFELFDISGRMIYSGSENRIDFSKEPVGVYYLRTSGTDYVNTKKIILTK